MNHSNNECIRCGAIDTSMGNGVTCSICIDAIAKGTELMGADRTGYQVPPTLAHQPVTAGLEKALEALEPFADQAEFWSSEVSDSTPLLEKDNLTVGDVRRAASALAALKSEGRK